METIVVAAVLVWRFLTTGGMGMLRMMNQPEATMAPGHRTHDHEGHEHPGHGEHHDHPEP